MSSTAFDITTRLADLVEAATKEGPQVLARDGVDAAVLISIEDWKHIEAGEFWKLKPDPVRRSLKEILLDPNGPHDIYIPPRGRYSRRKPIELE
jgi:prevent-host-death family protein